MDPHPRLRARLYEYRTPHMVGTAPSVPTRFWLGQYCADRRRARSAVRGINKAHGATEVETLLGGMRLQQKVRFHYIPGSQAELLMVSKCSACEVERGNDTNFHWGLGGQWVLVPSTR